MTWFSDTGNPRQAPSFNRITTKTPFLRKTAVIALTAVLGVIVVGCGSGSPDQTFSSPVERGRALYTQSCQICHGDAATGVGANVGAPPHSPEGHTWHHADGQLVDLVLGRLEYPNRVMPSFGGQLSKQDVLDILAYLKTNWSEEQKAMQSEASKNWEEMYGPASS